MILAERIRPAGPYSLALTARGASDATRLWRDGILRAAVRGEQASAEQFPDGTVLLRGSERAIERLRWMLALDDDHTEFLRRFKHDRLLRGPITHLQGMRVLRVDSVAQALLRALCGQLIESRRARAIDTAADRRETHEVPRYAYELASAFSAFYRDCKVLSEDGELSAARLALVDATRSVLVNGLRLLGISAPDAM